MAAPKGNQFWRNRSEHGRDYLFANPQDLWRAAEEYFNWCDAHPWYKVEVNKSAAEKAERLIKVPLARPYTLSGLCVYIGASEKYWYSFKKNLPDEDFLYIIMRIESTISTQQFEGAAVGSFNANIIARKQGLSEKVDANLGNKKDADDVSIPFKITLNL
jgi:hypothetical protein